MDAVSLLNLAKFDISTVSLKGESLVVRTKVGRFLDTPVLTTNSS